jgi:hypothetical protein
MTNDKPAPDHANCAEEACPSGKRNQYFRHKSLTASDFALEQHYGIERRRLLSRTIYGWGVAYGFELTISNGRLEIGKGLALDRHGRELFRAAAGDVAPNEIKVFGLDDQIEKAKETDGADTTAALETPHKCLLQAHYAERCVDRVRLGNVCSDGEDKWNHVCETIVFSLKPFCPGDSDPSDESSCPAVCEGCAPNENAARYARAQDADRCLDRGPHNRLCEWLTKRDSCSDADDMCCWNKQTVAFAKAVPLAFVTIKFDKCGHPVFQSIVDACTPRRLIKTNDLLFDLIRGCDLTHINEVSWSKWHRSKDTVTWDEFEAMFLRGGSAAEDTAQQRPGVRRSVPPDVTTGFSVTFSCPVEKETLTAECFAVTCLVKDQGAGWIKTLRVPVVKVGFGAARDTTETTPKNTTETTTKTATLIVSGSWCRDEIWGYESRLNNHEFTAEIEIRGDLILDYRGQAIDANPVGLRAAPTGNGTPGGTYLSTFRVAGKTQDNDQA